MPIDCGMPFCPALGVGGHVSRTERGEQAHAPAGLCYHAHLRPTAFLSEFANASAEARANLGWHSTIMEIFLRAKLSQ
jgi:hypothetical protein